MVLVLVWVTPCPVAEYSVVIPGTGGGEGRGECSTAIAGSSAGWHSPIMHAYCRISPPLYYYCYYYHSYFIITMLCPHPALLHRHRHRRRLGREGRGGGGVGAHPPLWTGPLLPHNAIATEILDGSYDCRGAAATRLWRASLSCGGGARTGLHRAPGSVWSVVGQAVIVRCDLEGVRREIMDWRKAPGKESLTSRTGATHEGQVSELPRQICGASLIHPSAHPPKSVILPTWISALSSSWSSSPSPFSTMPFSSCSTLRCFRESLPLYKRISHNFLVPVWYPHLFVCWVYICTYIHMIQESWSPGFSWH